MGYIRVLVLSKKGKTLISRRVGNDFYRSWEFKETKQTNKKGKFDRVFLVEKEKEQKTKCNNNKWTINKQEEEENVCPSKNDYDTSSQE